MRQIAGNHVERRNRSEEMKLGDNKDARSDQEIAKALSHPIRVEILEALQGRVASAGELSREMDQTPAVISYHAKTLINCGCVELVHREPHHGSIEHFFGSALRSVLGPAAFETQRRPTREDEKD